MNASTPIYGVTPTEKPATPELRAEPDPSAIRRPQARFQILALDGGGLRGLFSAAVLARLEEKTGAVMVDHFDLIAGTSTGGLIALGLGLGMRPRELVEFYVREGRAIFRNRFGWRSGLQLLCRKYPQARLESALRSKSAYGERLFGESAKRLVIPSFNLSTNAVRVFRTPHIPELTTDLHIPAWQVGLATSAAPTYFSSCRLKDAALIDGGVWANNPSLTALAEAMGALQQTPESIRLLTLGTTVTRPRRSRFLRAGGFGPWLWRSAVTDVLLSAQTVGAVGICQHLIGKPNVTRIDANVPDGVHVLDAVTVDDLLAEAEQTAMHAVPLFMSQFLAHRAPAYEPYHRKEHLHVGQS